MAGLTFEVALCYLDDLIIFCRTIGEHLERLRLVLDRLSGAGLKLKHSKCRLFQTSVEFLGHIVSAGKIAVNPAKILAVVDWPVPENVREVRGFIGLCSYYRRFIKGFGEIATPLNALAKKNKKFVWYEQCHEAFDTLKRCLTTAPVLSMPNDDEPFILDTDASAISIGAVLSQVQGGVEKPVAYASRKLSRLEKNYCVFKRELLAVVYFLKYFRHRLLGRKFTVGTDHAALQWLRDVPKPASTLDQPNRGVRLRRHPSAGDPLLECRYSFQAAMPK